MKINDIATAAQSLSNYCYRAGEFAEVGVLESQIRLLADRLEVIKRERTREKVTK